MKRWERRVFGWRKVAVDGRRYVLEMRTEGVFVKARHSRRGWRMVSFADVIAESEWQGRLAL